MRDRSPRESRELPFGPWHYAACSGWTIAHRKDVGAITRIGDRISDRSSDRVAERDCVRRHIDDDVAAHEPGDRPLNGSNLRRQKVKRPRSRRNVPLPPERDNRDAPFHQQRVAVEVGGSRRRVGVATEIEDERRHHAAVDDIDDCEIGRARGILGSKHHELAYGFHFPDRITRRQREIDDSPVLGIVRIER